MRVLIFICLFLNVKTQTTIQANTLGSKMMLDSVPNESEDCNCKKKRPNLFGGEAARWTVAPNFSPMISTHHQVFSNNTLLNSSEEINLSLQARLFYYIPNNHLNAGIDLSYMDRSITIKDALLPTFYSQEIELNPFIGYKTGDFSKTSHLVADVGFAYSYLLSSATRTGDNLGKTTTYRIINIFNSNKFHVTAGFGVYFDIFRSGWDKVGVFSASLKYHLPFQGNFFKPINLDSSNIFFPYSDLSTKWDYLTFSVGAVIDIRKNKSFGYSSHEIDDFVKNKKKRNRSAIFRPPFSFTKPGNGKLFGGFNASIAFMSKLDSSNFVQHSLPDSFISFRPKYVFSLGYNLHFFSNHRSGSNFSFDCFSGVDLQFKHFLTDNSSGSYYYKLWQPGGILGLRVGFSDGFLFGGGRIGYSLIGERGFLNNQIKDPVEFPKFQYSYFVGIGFRNFLSIQLETEPLIKTLGRTFIEKGPYYIKLVAGF